MHFFLHRFAATEQIETGPGEQARDRIEVGAKGLAADAGGLEGNGTATAKAIADAGRVAEGALTELFDQFRQGWWRVVPRWALISAHAAAVGPATFSGRSQ